MTIWKHRISFESLFELNGIKDWIFFFGIDHNTVYFSGLFEHGLWTSGKELQSLPENIETTKTSVKLWFKLDTVFLLS